MPTPVLSPAGLKPTRRGFLIGAGSLLVLVAVPGCGREDAASSGETRTVRHAMGETEVPVKPERIVAVDTFAIDTLLALGVEPVGVRDQETIPAYMVDGVEGVESIGSPEPNLEAVAVLEPDLILTLEGSEVYDELSQIAPTVAPAFETSADWKEVHLKYSEALGMEEEGRQVLDDYEARIEEFREAMGGRLEETEVSILRASAENLRFDLPGIFIGNVVYNDAGLSLPPRLEGYLDEDPDRPTLEISREQLGLVEGSDVLFVWTFGAGSELAEKEREALQELREDPLWQQLDVVQRGEVYVGGDYWIGSGPTAANLVLDDLEKYLLEEEAGDRS